jgi:hypothetical protein
MAVSPTRTECRRTSRMGRPSTCDNSAMVNRTCAARASCPAAPPCHRTTAAPGLANLPQRSPLRFERAVQRSGETPYRRCPRAPTTLTTQHLSCNQTAALHPACLLPFNGSGRPQNGRRRRTQAEAYVARTSVRRSRARDERRRQNVSESRISGYSGGGVLTSRPGTATSNWYRRLFTARTRWNKVARPWALTTRKSSAAVPR